MSSLGDDAYEQGTMGCGHCGRQVYVLHCGSGPGLCCRCVHVKRVWLALGGNPYCKDALNNTGEHANGTWCKEPPSKERGRWDDSEDCEGWQMAHVREDAWFEKEMSSR